MTARAAERSEVLTPAAQELLATKLTPPPLRTGYVRRPRLLDNLTAGLAARLTLVDAPTGYGKTMLVAGWCADLAADPARTVAWLSLSPAENDPALLTRYLIGALRVAGEEIGARTETTLRVPGASPTAWMGPLVNDLTAAEADVTLVLDDFHVLTEPQCHAIVQFLLDHSPPSVHLVVCTRGDPHLSLGALRAAGQLAELRAADLRFTPPEAEALLVDAEGLALGQEAIASLASRTEGWGAGLYLAALWLRGRGGGQDGVERFAGDNRHLVDYLREVVLGGLDDDVRDFLLRTSIVDRLCTSLCEAITEAPAAGVLEAVERSNLFLVPLDDSRTWYRYHQLFGQMLRSELGRREPGLPEVLHRRAGAWYRDHGLVSEAIGHATAAGDHADAAALIAANWLVVGRWGQEATIKAWLAAFPPDELARHAELGLIGAFLTAVSGGPEPEFRRWLELAEQGLTREGGDDTRVAGTPSLRAGVGLLRSTFGYRDVRAAAQGAARTARAESDSGGVLRVAALASLGFLLYLSGDAGRARHAVSEVMRDPEAQRRPYGFISALTTGALIALDEGDADRGRQAADRALEFAATAGLAENHIAGLAHVAVGRALAAGGQGGRAHVELGCGVRLLRGGVAPASHVYALLWAAPAAQADGDPAEALALVEEAESLLASFEDAGILTDLHRDVRRRLTLTRRRRRDPSSSELTETELAVLRLLRTPRSQRAIAEQLSLSINTVKTHTSAIYRKLGVSSREDALVRAAELHLR